MDFPNDITTGILKMRHYDEPVDYKAITQEWLYEDGGKDFNETAEPEVAPRRWEIIYTGKSRAQANVFESFYNTVRFITPFDFTDKFGFKWSNVHIEEYNRTHADHLSDINTVRFQLVAYNSVRTDVGAPVVEIVTPTAGENVFGSILLSAIATDNVAVDRVEWFYYDGLGFAPLHIDFTSPYEYTFDISGFSPGTLVISATAFDTSEIPSAATFVTVNIISESEGDLTFEGDEVTFEDEVSTFDP